MKRCRECRALKPLGEYYKHNGMADGHLNKCKSCVKSRVRKYRVENIEQIREYDRLRGQLERRKDNVKHVRVQRRRHPEKHAADLEASRRWRGRNKIKRACHIIVEHAIKDGKLVAKDCERCGAGREGNEIQAHHEDYSKPLDVVWLCTVCHGKRHREIKKSKRRRAAKDTLRKVDRLRVNGSSRPGRQIRA